MGSKRARGSLFPNWDEANQRRADRANLEFIERAEMLRDVNTADGRRFVWALPKGEPLNPLDELGLLLLPLIAIYKRFIGRGDYKVIVARQTRMGFLWTEYRSDRLTKAQAKALVADLVALSEVQSC